jgi:photosystem II stability/assembly factor-like uncharacterized protein
VSVFLTTLDGRLIALHRDADGAATAHTALEAHEQAQCVATDGSRVLVGTRGNGALLSNDDGATWERIDLPEPDVFAVAISPADGALYAGTEPSRLFVARDGGAWTELEALQDIPSRPRWSFPPRPWTHHVRCIAPDPHRAERVLVGIELGGVMRSDDGGATFSDHRPGAKLDAHQLAWHPHEPDRAYQAAGDGAAWTRDGGGTWEALDRGRDRGYCWALALDPRDPERWFVSAASGPGAAHRGATARGRLYRYEDGAFHRLPLAETDDDEPMPYALAVDDDGALLVALADGRVLRSADQGGRFEATGVDLGPILAMAASG